MDCPEIGLHDETTLFEYVACILLKFAVKMTNCGKTIRNEIPITQLNDVSSYDIYALVSSPEKRQHLIDHGTEIADAFLLSHPEHDASCRYAINPKSL